MKLADDFRQIDRIAIANETSFSIKGTGKAFRVLSSSLYRDKIQAVIREVCSNAYDGHVAAGHPEMPFEVHLPNRLEPFFSVRDFGTGLSPDDMNTLYTTYFESTKTNSNKFIGALGLGSKSPFSYADSFTATSWFAGMQRTYAAYMSEGGMFSLTCMGSISSNQRAGIEVTIPVRHESDFAEFREKARLVLSRFKDRPTIRGDAEFTFTNYETLVEGANWRLTSRAKEGGQALAYMGNVAYPIVPSAISMLDEDTRRVLSVAMDLDFPIGALDVTAGREDLSYDKPTLDALTRRAQVVLEEAKQVVADRLGACETEYAARIHYTALFHDSGPFVRIVGSGGFAFGNTHILSNVISITLGDYPGCHVSVFTEGTNRRRVVHSYTPSADVQVIASHTTVIVVDDLARGTTARVQQFLTLGDGSRPKPNIAYVVQADDIASLELLLRRLDGASIVHASSLPALPSRRYEKRPEQTLNPSCFGNCQQLSEASWRPRQIDLAAGGLYVRRSHHYVLNEDGKMDKEFRHLLNAAFTLGFIDRNTVIAGVNSAHLKKIVGDPRWTRLDAFVRDAIQSDPNASKWLKAMAIREDRRQTLNDNWRTAPNVSNIQRHVAGLGSSHVISTFVTDWIRADAVAQDSKARAYMDLCKSFGVSAILGSDTPNFAQRFAAINALYPLLRLIGDSADKIPSGHVLAYIKWVDEGSP